jgi:DNA-binding CsgD family transcriptional regulator
MQPDIRLLAYVSAQGELYNRRKSSWQSNRVIADQLLMSGPTVERYTGNVFLQLRLQSRPQIAARAVENGLAGAT